MVSERILRRASAWALPRPSAMASAKLAKSTVRNSQTVIDQLKMPPCAMDSMKGDDRADQHDEHDRVLDLHPGIELGERPGEGLLQDLRVEEAAGLRHAVGRRGSGGGASVAMTVI